MEFSAGLLAIDEGINLWWRTIGSTCGFARHAGDIEWVAADNRNGPERIYNVRLSSENTEARIAEITDAMKQGTLPSGMLLTPLSTPSNIVELLMQMGIQIDDSCPCMALELSTFCPPPMNEAIRVVSVRDREALRLWAGIVNTGLFGCELFSLEQYNAMLSQENTRLYLATLGGCPASACMTIHGEGVATLECVATLPEFRRKGLGAAVVSQALLGLKTLGVGNATLRSEPDGISLYKKLGFVEHCRRIVASV